MPDKTIHGWPVIFMASDPKLKSFTIPGTKRKIKLHKQLGPYLVAFAAEYHKLIEPIDTGTFDDWGWSPVRKGRASDQISDHCAGVAMDLNATGPDGRQGHGLTWWLKNPVKYARLKGLLRKYRLLEAGITYKRFLDPMHYTFKNGVGTAAVLAEMKRLGIGPDGAIQPKSPVSHSKTRTCWGVRYYRTPLFRRPRGLYGPPRAILGLVLLW